MDSSNCYICYKVDENDDLYDLNTMVTSKSGRSADAFLIENLSIDISEEEDARICVDCKYRIDSLDELLVEVSEAKEKLLKDYEETQEKWNHRPSALNWIEPAIQEVLEDDEEIVKEDDEEEEEEKEEIEVVEQVVDFVEMCNSENSDEYEYVIKEEIIEEEENHSEQPILKDPKETPNPYEGMYVEHENRFHCTQCDRIYKSKGSVAYHIRQRHIVNTRFECHICTKSFARKENLVLHARTHTGEYKYQVRLNVLHATMYNNYFLFLTLQCDQCGKSFIHLVSFNAHQKMHNNTRDTCCELCGRAFRSKSHLNQHMKIHKGIMDYSCPGCGRKFIQKFNMNLHYKNSADCKKKAINCTEEEMKFIHKSLK